jgi:hypothetical protein
MEHEIELTSELVATFTAGIDYGIIEVKRIPTQELSLPILGRFGHFHVALVILVAIVGSALAWSHVQWLLNSVAYG